MYTIKFSNQFKKDLKRIKKSGRKKKDIEKMEEVIDLLAIPEILPERNVDHGLTGNLKDYRECHILPNLLLIYQYIDEYNELLLYRIGSHSELFNK